MPQSEASKARHRQRSKEHYYSMTEAEREEHRRRAREYYARKREERKQYTKDNRARIREYERKYREKTKDERNAQDRDRYKNDAEYSERRRMYSRQWRADHPEKVAEWEAKRIQRQNDMQQKCVEYLGGRCMVCGLVDDPISYDFHHIDRSTKRFQISENFHKSWETLVIELDKCALLCCICHRKVEWRGVVLPTPGLNPVVEAGQIDEHTPHLPQ